MSLKHEVVIAGMGPAGMAAAVELAELEIDVAVVDENKSPGGQIYRQISEDFILTDPSFLGLKYKKGKELLERFGACQEKVTLYNETNIWGFFNGSDLTIIHEGDNRLLTYDRLLLAEGAMERSIPFPGWTLPGVMTLGGLQKMVMHDRILPGRRFLLAGCSPLLYPVAASLLNEGAEIVALCDTITTKEQIKLIPQLMRQTGLAKEAAAYFFPVIKKSVKKHKPFTVISTSGEGSVETVSIARLDKDWRPVPGTEMSMDVDVIGISYGFLPSGRLPRLCGCEHIFDQSQAYWKPDTDKYLRSSNPDIYIAGDCGGIVGADMAEIQGRIAATHIAHELGKLSARDMETRMHGLFVAGDRINRYLDVLNKVYATRSGLYSIMDEKTVVCRCENATVGDIKLGMEEFGYRNINEIKRTRAGMGLCQGRTCESITTQLLIQNGVSIEEIGYMNLRPPLTPMPFSSFESWG